MSLSEYVDAGNTNPLIAVGKIVLWFIQKCIALWSDSAFVQYTGISLLSILLAFFAMWVIVNIFVIRPIGVPIADTIVESSRRSSARAAAQRALDEKNAKAHQDYIKQVSVSWKNQRPISRPSSQSSSGHWNREKAYAELRANQQRAKADHNRAIRDGRAHYE